MGQCSQMMDHNGDENNFKMILQRRKAEESRNPKCKVVIKVIRIPTLKFKSQIFKIIFNVKLRIL